MEERERVSGARLAADSDEDATPPGERLENAAVVGLESDAPHGAGKAERRQIAGAPLQRGDEWTVRDDRTDRAQLETIAGRSKCLRDQRRRVRSVFRDDGGSLRRKARLLQRIERLGGPCGILKDCNREKTGVGVDHHRYYRLLRSGQ